MSTETGPESISQSGASTNLSKIIEIGRPVVHALTQQLDELQAHAAPDQTVIIHHHPLLRYIDDTHVRRLLNDEDLSQRLRYRVIGSTAPSISEPAELVQALIASSLIDGNFGAESITVPVVNWGITWHRPRPTEPEEPMRFGLAIQVTDFAKSKPGAQTTGFVFQDEKNNINRLTGARVNYSSRPRQGKSPVHYIRLAEIAGRDHNAAWTLTRLALGEPPSHLKLAGIAVVERERNR